MSDEPSIRFAVPTTAVTSLTTQVNAPPAESGSGGPKKFVQLLPPQAASAPFGVEQMIDVLFEQRQLPSSQVGPTVQTEQSGEPAQSTFTREMKSSAVSALWPKPVQPTSRTVSR